MNLVSTPEGEFGQLAERKVKIKYGTVQVFDDIVPRELYRQLVVVSRRIPWRFGWNTPSNPNMRYWHHEVGGGGKNNIEDISHNVERHPGKVFAAYQEWLRSAVVPRDTKVLRYYLNGHTFGTDGWPHTDTDRHEELTMVLYLASEWKPEWCGETVVFNQERNDIDRAVLPAPNRLLVFPSDRLHCPRPLSKVFEGLRIVLVVKMGSPTNKGIFFEGN